MAIKTATEFLKSVDSKGLSTWFHFIFPFFSGQDKSGRAMSDLLARHDISKFGELMSVVVVESWPKDATGKHIQGEDLIFQYLMNWPMAKTIFQIAGKF